MSMNGAASTILDNDAVAPPKATARRTIWGRKAGRREWWRLAAQPFVLATGFLVLAVISATSIVFVVISQSNTDLVAHTLRVEIRLSSLEAVIRNAESRARGYLITDDPVYQIDFRRVAATIMPTFQTLRETTADNVVQQQALDQLGPLIVQQLDRLQEVLRLNEAGQKAAATAVVHSETGNALMDEISVIVFQMTAEERRLLQLRAARVARSIYLSMAVNLAGIALMIALAAISILAVRRMGEEALRDSEKRGGELQAAVNELDAFSYSVSHDLRTPLRAIDGFSRILLKHHASDLAPEPREYLQAVRDNTVQMGHLVDDLLAFARLNRKQLSKKRVPTAAIVEQVVREVQQQAEGRCVNVSVGHLPPVWGDAALLKQVFANLIDNAFKYTRLRKDAVVEIGSRNIGGEQVIFVRDNGVGFDMQFTDKLFGVFQRLHRAEDFEGTGVGLAIVQRIVHRHGGRIWAEAAVNQGAAFYFTMEVPNHA
jgi:signal transduction histidine kinase